MRHSLLLLCALFIGPIVAQQSYTVSGILSDATTGERLIGATIYDKDRNIGTTSNVYGFYSITAESDTLDLIFSYVSYEPQKKRVVLLDDVRLDIELSTNSTLGEVVITGEREDFEETRMSAVKMDMEVVKSLPVLLGERDLLKSIQLLPGVQSGGEGTSGIYVRGGGPDQNLFLLDGVPLYNVSHLFGFFSVFNPDGIGSVELMKGGFPARHGGRLSSVVDIRMKEGNKEKLHGEGGIGIISSRLTMEGPIKNEKTTFLMSARRTYIDILAQPLIAASGDGETGGYFFYDMNGKINHTIDDKNRVYLSGYFGNDKAYYRFKDDFADVEQRDKARLAWGNAIVAARWNRIISPKLFANTTLTMSNYRLVTSYESEYPGGEFPDEYYEYRSGINDVGVKVDFDYIPNPDHLTKGGIGYTYHTFNPGASRFEGSDGNQEFGPGKVYANEMYAFAEDDWKVSDKLKINGGVRLSAFYVDQKFRGAVEPRISGRLLVGSRQSFKASYSRMVQYLHLLTSGSIGLPIDLWVPVTGQIAPQRSDQIAAGWSKKLSDDFELTIEGYYKWMNDLIEYKEGASFQGFGEDWQDKVEVGDGESYGGEVLLRKKLGNLTGWLGYTLSWSTRQFENLNFGEAFPYKFDRRHDIGLALKYQTSEKLDIGMVWVYGSGNAFSLPSARYETSGGIPGQQTAWGYQFPVEHIESRNGYRMRSYHRLDLGLNLHKEKKWGTRTWSLGVYNAYGRLNPFFLFFKNEGNGTRGLYQQSLFPLIPSVSYNFKF